MITFNHSIFGAGLPTTSMQQNALSPSFATKCVGTFSENFGRRRIEPIALSGVALLTNVTIEIQSSQNIH